MMQKYTLEDRAKAEEQIKLYLKRTEKATADLNKASELLGKIYQQATEHTLPHEYRIKQILKLFYSENTNEDC